MNISLNWVNRYVKVDDIDAKELAEKISLVGLEVEDVKPLAYGTNLVIGYVRNCVDHPDSDHLHICEVEIEPGMISQIVCGAPNVAINQKVIVALPGCVLPGDFTIKKSVIRGVESNGMICSLSELGIDSRFLNDEQKAGIEVLDSNAPIGEKALEYLGLEDLILDLGLTPNRSDCLAVSSFAYEVAAVLKRDIKLPNIKYTGELKSDIDVEIATDLCTCFGTKLVKGVKIGESPQWLKSLLMASGVKPINNIVDISNFVMLETGQPIHMYDYDKLKTKKFVIKTGFNREETLLDGEKYAILENDLIILENDKVACIAGVMGSDSTKIDENTVNIVIEAATFDGATLRSTARRLNLLTDASNRFIKNALNSSATADILERCANLLEELADAKEIYKADVISKIDFKQRELILKTASVNKLLGTSIIDKEIKAIFKDLNFKNEYLNDGEFKVFVPTYRNDITMEVDLIEEIARLYGYENIPTTLPKMRDYAAGYSLVQDKRNRITNTLANLGLKETRTYSLTNPIIVDDFNYFHHKQENLALLSPLGEERSVLRKSLIPSLLQVVNYNTSHTLKNIGIFEISNTYSKNQEVSILSIVGSGTYLQNKWQQINKNYDFYVMKGFVEKVFNQLGIESSRYQLKILDKTQTNLHPGRSAYIMIGKKLVGYLGQLHPMMQKKYDVEETYVCELNLSELLELKTGKIKYQALPVYPSVLRDIAVVVDQDIQTSDLLNTIKRAGKLVNSAEVFDVYVGEHIEENKKSVAIAITFLDKSKTLEEKDINLLMDIIYKALVEKHSAKLRG